MSHAIEIKDLSMRFKDVHALSSVSVRFEENRIYGLLGRNGAGKTTLLNLINNRLFPSGGAVYIDGQPALENDAVQSKVFYIGEVQYMPDDDKVKDYFRQTAMFYEGFDMDYALRLAGEYGLDIKKKLKSLSTGYATITKLIAALATDAKYLLLDEPVLGLDANHRDKFYRDLLDNYGKNPRTIIISTHLIEEVANIIEQVVIIKDGTILIDRPAEEVRKMGYCVSGKAEDVDAYTQGKNVLSVDTLGGLKTACVLGMADAVPDSLEVTALDMQKMFIYLTNDRRGQA